MSRRHRARAESLERRCLLAVSIEGATLFVRGTMADDTIIVASGSITLNDEVTPFDTGLSIEICTYGGADVVKGSSSSLTSIRTGSGDDLVAWSGGASIRTGAGNDLVRAGTGNDYISGEDGR